MSAADPDIAACAGIVQRGDPDRFLAVMAAPVALREKLFPLFAFNVEVARAPWVTQESMIAEMRLQWWKDALEEIATGKDVRRHEVVAPLARALSRDAIPSLIQLIEARRWDIYYEPFTGEEAFRTYLDQTAGTLLQTACSMCADTFENSFKTIGYAHGMAQWFRAIPVLLAQKRKPFLANEPQLAQQFAADALAKLDAAKVPKSVRPATYMCWQDRVMLKRVVQNPDCILDGTLESSAFRSKLGLMLFTRFGF